MRMLGTLLSPRVLLPRALLLVMAVAPATSAQGFDLAGPTPRPSQSGYGLRSVRIAVIGDYGNDGPAEAAVAALVKTLAPDFVVTLGDNNYPSGEAATIDANIGKHYHEFIAPYFGIYGAGGPFNRFFPALGNHDWLTAGAAPYLAYFTLPGNERYYSVNLGPVDLFVVDSDSNEPHGNTATSVQGQWLQLALAASTAPFRFVAMHHAPWSSSSNHGSQEKLQWPFAAWGASAVFAGHDHLYERLVFDRIPFFVNGLGGTTNAYTFGTPIAGSQERFDSNFGAMLVTVEGERARLQFVTWNGSVIDDFSMSTTFASVQPSVLVPAKSTWKYLDTGFDPGPTWKGLGYDDSAWASGAAQLGYGDGDEATVVSFGPNAAAKFPTTWFRKTFTAPALPSDAVVRLRLLRDDGAIVHLNGVEVFRSNLPAGAVTSATLASSSVSSGAEDSFYETIVAPSLLAAGTNVLAVEVHQQSASSGDLSFDLELEVARAPRVLVPTGSVWRYLDGGVPPRESWTLPGFDDSPWASGPAQLGYGDGDEATVVGFGGNAQQKHPTTWFRHTFSANGVGAAKRAWLRVLRDDGVVVHLNGVEVHRDHVAFGPLLPTDFATETVSGEAESTFFTTGIDPRLLRDGTNVLAVELRQVSSTSSDVSFDLELSIE